MTREETYAELRWLEYQRNVAKRRQSPGSPIMVEQYEREIARLRDALKTPTPTVQTGTAVRHAK